jgi:hypothetical protein
MDPGGALSHTGLSAGMRFVSFRVGAASPVTT